MIKFLVYLAIVLFIIAATQLIKVFELATVLKGGDNSQKANEKDNRLQGRLFLLFLIAFYAFVIWECWEYKDMLLPESASAHGKNIDFILNINFIIIFIVFFVVNAFLFWMAFRYYSTKESKATFYPHNNMLELVWTIIPSIVLALIIVLGLTAWNDIMMKPIDPKNSINIELYAKQFDWTARYGGKDNTLGKAHYRLIDDGANNSLGLDTTDAANFDDIIVKNEFHIPKGKEINFTFRSRDVIHSAYFPHFRAQMNCVPGMTTSFHFLPEITTAEMRQKTGKPDFDYILLCNKICGASHYNMQMKIVVDTPEDYQKWLATQTAFRQPATPTSPATADNTNQKTEKETETAASTDKAASH